MRSSFWTTGLLFAAGAVVTVAGDARAQQAPSADVVEVQPASTKPMPVPTELMETHPGGLTAQQVGERAVTTSFNAKQALETMRSAEARVDQQWTTFLPRLTGTARYTRLSDFTPPVFGSSQGSSVGTNITASGPLPVPITPGQPVAGTQGPVAQLYATPGITIPLILNQWLLQANLTIPLSDYLWKTNESFSAATKSAEAARYDLASVRTTAFSNGKVAYYTWLQARSAVVVAVQALNDQRNHLTDARNQFTVGNASKADVLRAETAEAAAELQVETAKNAADLAETQMRIAIHGPPDQHLLPAEGLDVVPPTFQGNLSSLVQEGLATRSEVKSAETNAAANRKLAAAQRGGGYPAISAFGDAIYGNPNSRYFPQTQDWHATWDVGAQAVWSPNDLALGGAGSKDYEARARALEANVQVVREAIEIEITQMYEQVKQSDVALDSTKRELASAQEAYRVARELFNNGRGTSTTLADAETDLTRARLDALNATVNARVARVRLDHAVGRDLRAAGISP